MRLVMYSTPAAGRDPRPGAQIDAGIVDIATALNRHELRSVAGLLAHGPDLLAELRAAVEQIKRDPDGAVVSSCLFTAAQGPLKLHAPIGEPRLILGAGANYRSHVAEMAVEVKRSPSFIKNPNAVIATGDPIRLPDGEPSMIDYEGELGVVIGRPCYRVSADEAIDYVAGYTLVNDVSARDAMGALFGATNPADIRDGVLSVVEGKQLPTFAPMGPAVITADEIPDPTVLRLITRLNGTVMQDAPVSDLIVSIPELIADFTRTYNLQPGDVLSTGTPAGVGVAQNPPVFLKPGDKVEVSVHGIGELINPVVSESPR